MDILAKKCCGAGKLTVCIIFTSLNVPTAPFIQASLPTFHGALIEESL